MYTCAVVSGIISAARLAERKDIASMTTLAAATPLVNKRHPPPAVSIPKAGHDIPSARHSHYRRNHKQEFLAIPPCLKNTTSHPQPLLDTFSQNVLGAISALASVWKVLRLNNE